MPVVDMVKIEKRYASQWVALSDDQKRVLAAGPTLKDALANARRKGFRNPILPKIPRQFLEYIL